MKDSEIDDIIRGQKEFFDKGICRKTDFRIRQLKRLKQGIGKHENDILHALKQDMGKPAVEAFASEISWESYF